MNKEKFLLELREYLSILENQEQEDILAEYAQHIDMKMGKGLSEEEVILDFGSVEELAAEILEAYHVKPEFRKKPGTFFGLPEAGAAETDGSLIKRAGRFIKKMFFGMVCRVKKGFSWIGVKCRSVGRTFFHGAGNSTADTRKKLRLSEFAKRISQTGAVRFFTGNGKRTGEEDMESGYIMEGTGERKEAGKGSGSFWRLIGRGIAAAWRWCLNVCIFWLKLMWNAGWLLFALICAGMALVMLMGVGAMPILLFQGYPLAGIFIICIGGLMCLCALTCGAFSLLIRGKRDYTDKETEKFGEEEAYEQTA